MTMVEEWRLIFTDFDESHAEPSAAAYATGQAFKSLEDAIVAADAASPGTYPWIGGDEGTVYTPRQIRPVRKLFKR